MKFSALLLTAFAGILFFSSCQKGLDESITTTPNSPTSSSRPKTYSESIYYAGGGHDSITFNLSYDANGRLISMISASSPGDKFIYQYSGNTIAMDLFNSNLLSIHQVSYLNSFSFIDSSFQYNDTKDTMTEKYLYNSNKKLVTLKQYDYSAASGAVLFETTNYTYDTNGNLTKEVTSSSITTYEYSALSNTFSLGLDYLPANKNLVSKTIYTSGGSTTILNHTYTFDSSNRLTSEKIIADSGDIFIRTYTY